MVAVMRSAETRKHAVRLLLAPQGAISAAATKLLFLLVVLCAGDEGFPCDGGHFFSLESSACLVCPAGHFCEQGTHIPAPCGGSSFYCPEGSREATKVPDGSFSVGGGEETRHGHEVCGEGHYCVDGRMRPCPAGTYCAGTGLKFFSGKCDAGYYCPEGSINSTAIHCPEAGEEEGVAFYCPPGSALPLRVSEGFYITNGNLTSQSPCPPGHFCNARGEVIPCDRGYYGDSWFLTNSTCSGECAEGFDCPEGSFSPSHGSHSIPTVPAGYFYVPAAERGETGEAFSIAPAGFYADRGVKYKCPAGYYGSNAGLSAAECSGPCEAGFVCESGSTSPRQKACGPGNICPPGAHTPEPVLDGYYSTAHGSTEAPCPPGHFRNASRDPTDGMKSVVATSAPLGACVLCPEGFFKAGIGDDQGLCKECNSYVSVSVADRTTCECFRLGGGSMDWVRLFFNTTLEDCVSVPANFAEPAPLSYANTSFAAIGQQKCETGTYCSGGVRFLCPEGTFGAEEGLTSALCSGPCQAGFYCPAGSTSSHEKPCGNADVYCPSGSAVPTRCPSGSYTLPESNGATTDTPRHSARRCPPGHYCTDGLRYPCPAGYYTDEEELGSLKSCIPCPPGYYCPEGSEHPRECGGVEWFCPGKATNPEPAWPGFYTLSGGPQGGSQGPTLRSVQILCEPGHYCQGGVKYLCPPGTWHYDYGVGSASECQLCSAGSYCEGGGSRPALCHEADSFCPPGSKAPSPVAAGYYSIGGSDGMTAQVMCESGHFCRGGVRFPCRGGTFGAVPGLMTEFCSGSCPAGFSCPGGTVDPIPCEAGEQYAPAGSLKCVDCPSSPLGVLRISREKTCADHRDCCGGGG